jgi:NHL repeat
VKVRQHAALLAAVALAGGAYVATSHPQGASATTPAPGSISTYAGGGPESGTAIAIPQAPRALAVSGSTLYVADPDDELVWSLDTTTGFEKVIAGDGKRGSTGDGRSATAAELTGPSGLALDSSGNLYIASGLDYRLGGPWAVIRMVTPAGLITTVAGGGTGALGDGGPATSATLNNAQGVAVDASGDLFIADSGDNRIRRVDHTTGIITTVAGNGTAGFAGDAGAATSAELNDPQDVWVDSGGTNFWIADTGNARVRAVSSGTISTVAGGGTAGDGGPATAALLQGPTGVWVDSSGNLLITDSAAARVREVSGGIISTVAGTGTLGYNGDGISATSAELNYPIRAIGDGLGNLYIADYVNFRVRQISGGTIQTIAGTGGRPGACVLYGEGGQATDATLCSPYGIAVDTSGDLFFSDEVTNVVRKVTPGGLISTMAGNGKPGASGDNGLATAAELWGPTGIAVDAAGDLFIADTGNEVVRKVDHATGIITRLAGTTGSFGFSGDGGPATSAQLNEPRGLAVDSTGGVLIADEMNGRIRRVDAAGVISTVAGGGDRVPNDVPATSAAFGATDVGVDGAGNFYVADQSGVYKVDSSGTIWTLETHPYISTNIALGLAVSATGSVIATTGCQALLITAGGTVPAAGTDNTCGVTSGDGGPATTAGFVSTAGAAFDASGDLYLVDGNRVRRIEAYGAPSAPTGVSATPERYSATVQWSAPTSSGGLPVTAYTVTPFNGAIPGAPIQVAGLPAPTSVYVPGLSIGLYTFTVAASNGWATGPASSASSGITPVPLASTGDIVNYAGAAGSGPATLIGQVPYSLAVAGTHIYVGDLTNPVIRDVDTTSGQETVLAGNDAYGYSGDGGPAVAAMIKGAGAIAYCGGVTYFADTDNYVIRKIDALGNISTVAGTGTPGYTGDGGPAVDAQLSRVFGLACRSGGGLYVSDSDNGAVRIIDAAGEIYTWWYGFSFPTGIVELGSKDVVAVSDAGNDHVVGRLTDKTASLIAGTPGYALGCYDQGEVGSLTSLDDPRGLAFAAGSLYIADAGCDNVRIVHPNHIVTIFTSGFEPTGLAFSSDGQLLAADPFDNVVYEFNLSTKGATILAGNRTPSLSGDGGQATLAQLGTPVALAIDHSGYQYVADSENDVIRKIAPNGVITTVAGIGKPGFGGDNGPATSAYLYDPQGVAVSSNGDIFISDTANNRVRKVDHVTGLISTVADINSPRGLAVDAGGDVFVADALNNTVWMVTPTEVVPFAGTGVAGYSNDGYVAASAELNGPEAVAVDALGDVYIADTLNNRVRRVDHVTNLITTVAGNGIFGLAGDGRAATASELAAPFGVAVDPEGRLYIADTFNQRIRLVDTNAKISTVVGTCGLIAAYAGDGGPAAFAHVNFPFGLATDAYGNVFIADVNNNRVRGAAGLIGQRESACPAPAGTPGARGANQLSSVTSLLARMAQHSSGSRGLIPDQPLSKARPATFKPVLAVARPKVKRLAPTPPRPGTVKPTGTVLLAGGPLAVFKLAVQASGRELTAAARSTSLYPIVGLSVMFAVVALLWLRRRRKHPHNSP